MHENLTDLLQTVVRDPDLHARWLNTFAYLEYIGFRKIVKSQVSQALTLEVLTHAAEESRHAILLKKLAIKEGGQAFDCFAFDKMICGEEAVRYFQELDQF